MSLADLIASSKPLVAPGVYDVATARLVERAGFECAYLTGAGLSMSATGFPDIGMISFSEVADRLSHIADNLSIPLIVDGDNGYGGVLNVVRTIREFERRGASAIQLEDQVTPKKCGHELGRRCVPIDEMVSKIRAALDTRENSDFLIIARTDARTPEGFDSALERALAYEEAGADIIFPESLESVDEMQAVRSAIKAPIMANMVEGGRTPLLSADELGEVGYDLAIFPNSVMRIVLKQVAGALDHLRETGSTKELLDQMWMHRDMWELFDHSRWVELEQQYEGQVAGSPES